MRSSKARTNAKWTSTKDYQDNYANIFKKKLTRTLEEVVASVHNQEVITSEEETMLRQAGQVEVADTAIVE